MGYPYGLWVRIQKQRGDILYAYYIIHTILAWKTTSLTVRGCNWFIIIITILKINIFIIHINIIIQIKMCVAWTQPPCVLGSGPCNGDSGGGMFLPSHTEGGGTRWLLRGVVSRSLKVVSTGECDLAQYVVFTDLAIFKTWITGKIRTTSPRGNWPLLLYKHYY